MLWAINWIAQPARTVNIKHQPTVLPVVQPCGRAFIAISRLRFAFDTRFAMGS
jgi:hypothetical protein